MLSVLTAYAQTSIDGTWSYTQKELEKDDKQGAEAEITMVLTYVFSGNSYNVKIHCVMDLGFEQGVLSVNADGTHSGTLVRNGDVLTLTPDKRKKPQVDVTTSADNVPGGGLIKTLVVGPFKREITNGLKEEEKLRIISITQNQLVMEDILTEKEIRGGEKAERVTFTRQ